MAFGDFEGWPFYFGLCLGALVIARPFSLVNDAQLWRAKRARAPKRAAQLQARALAEMVGSAAHTQAALRAHQARQTAQIKQQRNAKALQKAKRTHEQRARHISAAIGTAQGAARAASKSSIAAAGVARRARAKLLKTRERFGAVLSAACAAASGAAHSALTANNEVARCVLEAEAVMAIAAADEGQQADVVAFCMSLLNEADEEGGGAAAPPAALRPAVEDESDTTCVVCLDADRSHLYVPCGHKCVCAACAARVMAGDALCPVCRMAATAVVKVFG
jgi:hypothetical protein